MSRQRIEELAVMGGSPLFAQPLHVGRPNVPNRQKALGYIGDALERGWLTNDGPLVRRLEQLLAEYLEVPHCVATANGTVALEMLARALDLRGEVIMPAFTFVATAHAFRWLDITPVFCDVDADTHCIDVAHAERCITPRTSAVVAVHLWGSACAVGALQALSERRGVPVIYDAAHAFGLVTAGQHVGGFGIAEVFSFHATKFFNTFEGGAITTHDGELAARLRLARNFGFAGYDDIVALGINGKMSEAHAGIGLALLDEVPALIEKNARTWQRYADAVRAIPGLKLLSPNAGQGSNWQYVVCEVTPAAELSRDQLLQVLWAEQVRARRYFYPGCHRTPPYHQQANELPVTDRLVERTLVLPAGALLEPATVDAVTELLAFAVAHAGTLQAKLPTHVPPGGFKA